MAINPFIDSEIKRKAEAGIALDSPNAEKDALYKQYQDNVKRHIQNKAATGQQLDSPNDWKQGIYDEIRKQSTPQYTAPELPKVGDPSSYAQGMNEKATGYLNQIYEQQKQAQLEQLRGARDKAIGQINQQISQTEPEYQDKRNQTDAVNAQNVQRLREMMAAAGLTSTGENVTAQTSLNNQRLSSLNALNQQEQQTVDDYRRRISDLQNPSEENAMIAALEAERAKALYDAYNRSEDIGYQRYRDAIGDNRYADETAYNRYFNELNQRNYLDDRNYGRQRDQVADNQWQQSFDQQNRQYEAEKAWREYTYNNMSASEKAQLDQNAAQFGEEMAWRMYEMEYNGELTKSMSQAELASYGSELDFLP